MYPNRNGIKHTIISFEPLFHRADIKGLTDAQIGRKFGISTQIVKAMRYNQDVPFDTIRAICYVLNCQPGDIIKAVAAEYFPAKYE